jgi:hypothetical protein
MVETERSRVSSGLLGATLANRCIILPFRIELIMPGPYGELRVHVFGGQESTEKADRAFLSTPAARPTADNAATHQLPFSAYYTVD